MGSKSTRNTIVLCLIVIGSLAISVGLGAWLVRGLILERGPYFGSPGPTHRYQGATIWKGELWYAKFTPTKSGRMTFCHIHRRNLESGEDHETRLELIDPKELVATTDRMWIIGGYSDGGTVYETDGQSILQTSPSLPPVVNGPSGFPTFVCNYFVLDGVLSSIREYQPERYRMVQLIEGQWLDGLEVILPGMNRQWEDDERQQRKVLKPRSCSTQFPPKMGTPPASSPALIVVPDHGRIHLIATDGWRSFMAYREGFEFWESTSESASALIPANAPPDASGWEYVLEKSFMSLQSATVLRGMPVIAAYQADLQNVTYPGHPGVLVRTARDRFDVLDEVTSPLMMSIVLMKPPVLLWSPVLVSSPDHDVCYLLGQHPMQGAEIFAIEETSQRRLPQNLPGGEWPMIMWLGRLGLAIGAAWLAHLVVLVTGIGWFQSSPDRDIDSGHRLATLGSVPRRTMARGVDFAIILLPLVLHIVSLTGTADPVAVSHELHQFEGRIRMIPHLNWQGNYDNLIRNNLPYMVSAYSTLQWSLLGSLAVWFALVAVEGARGMTPGKWLCGLRTMRTTLRPCGFARAILRDVLLFADIPFLLTPIPAVLSCVRSPHCQRLGDRMADTVVVEARSIRARSTGGAVDFQAASVQPGPVVG